MIADSIRRLEIEEAVVDLIEDYGVESYPIDLFDISALMGIKVYGYDDVEPPISNLLRFTSPDACCVKDTQMTNLKMFINENTLPSSRAMFSMGHEIAHIWLEHEEGGFKSESEADYFSGYLLAPHPLIIQNSMTPYDAQVAFGIGSWCAEVACNQARTRSMHGAGNWMDHEIRLLELVHVSARKASETNSSSLEMMAAPRESHRRVSGMSR